MLLQELETMYSNPKVFVDFFLDMRHPPCEGSLTSEEGMYGRLESFYSNDPG